MADVVTNEVVAEAIEPQTETTQEPSQEAVAPEAEPKEESSEPAGQEAAPEKPKKGGWVRKLERAERENSELKDRLARLEQQATKPVQTVPIEGRPKLESFQDYDSYTEALAEWKAEQAITKREQQRQQEEDRRKFDTELREARAKYADYDEVVTGYDGFISPNLGSALMSSPLRADVAYKLLSNPERVDELNSLPPAMIQRAIMRMELDLEKPAERKAQVTKAPPPITPVGSRASTVPDVDKMSFQEYKAARLAGQIK